MGVKIYSVFNKGIHVRGNGVFTAPELIADAGVYFESAGGYYAGGNIMVDGKEYALIIAPRAEGQSSTTVEWKTSRSTTAGTNSTYNGRANTQAIIDAGLSDHPAAQFVTGLNIGGHNDWHLPSPDELEICYRYLKPLTLTNSTSHNALHSAPVGTNPNSNPVGNAYTTTDPSQTSVELFQVGGVEAFDDSSYYWASMEFGINGSWSQNVVYGIPYGGYKTNSYWSRAVRWVEV